MRAWGRREGHRMAGRACGTEKRESGRRKEELMGAAQLEVRKREKGGRAGRAACWPGVWATRKEEERGGVGARGKK